MNRITHFMHLEGQRNSWVNQRASIDSAQSKK